MAYALNATERRSEIILIAAAVVFQFALAPQISIAGGRINFMLVLAVSTALDGDVRRAVLTGFACGLLYDLSAPAPVGLMALLLTLASFALARISPAGSAGLSMGSARLVVAFSLIVNIVYGLLLVVMGQGTDLFTALVGHGLSSAILDALVCAPFLLARVFGVKRVGAARPRGARFKEKR